MHSLAMKASSGALVVREKLIDENGPIYVKIVARKSGLISWLLTLLLIDITTVLQITENSVRFEKGSISGRIKETLPMSAITNVGTGYLKPFTYIVYAIAFLILAIAFLILAPFFAGFNLILPIIFLILFLIFLIRFLIGKTMVVYLIPSSGSPCMICVKRSIIEMQSLSEQEAERIVNILTALVEHANK